MSSFEEALHCAARKERSLSLFQNALIAVTAGIVGVLLLLRPIPVPVHIDLPTLFFTLGVLLTLWDEPIWNEALGRWCSVLARGQVVWPCFALAMLTMKWWIPKDGSAFSAFTISAILILLMRGKAERKPIWIFLAVGGLFLVQRTASMAAALLILAPFFALVFGETVSRTKGRLDYPKKAWIPFSILLAGFFQIVALTTAF